MDIPETLQHILGYLEPDDLARCSVVCRRWLYWTAPLWKPFIDRAWRPALQSSFNHIQLAIASLRQHLLLSKSSSGEEYYVDDRTLYGELRRRLKVYSFGKNTGPRSWGTVTRPPYPDLGQLGREGPRDIACEIRCLRGRARSIACGGYHSLALLEDGSVVSFGSNAFGQLGLGDRKPRPSPRVLSSTLSASQRVKELFCGFAFTILRLHNDTVLSFGFNKNGRCGHDPLHPSTSKTVDGDSYEPLPRLISSSSSSSTPLKAQHVACGSGHTVLLSPEGTVLTFGRNDCGQCGVQSRKGEIKDSFTVAIASAPGQHIPRPIDLKEKQDGFIIDDDNNKEPPATTFKAVGAGPFNSLAISTEGDLYMWGIRNPFFHLIQPLPSKLALSSAEFVSSSLNATGAWTSSAGDSGVQLADGCTLLFANGAADTAMMLPPRSSINQAAFKALVDSIALGTVPASTSRGFKMPITCMSTGSMHSVVVTAGAGDLLVFGMERHGCLAQGSETSAIYSSAAFAGLLSSVSMHDSPSSTALYSYSDMMGNRSGEEEAAAPSSHQGDDDANDEDDEDEMMHDLIEPIRIRVADAQPPMGLPSKYFAIEVQCGAFHTLALILDLSF